MIYLDTSVALAQILTEATRAPSGFWDSTLTASRLLHYEVWNRLHARNASRYRHERARHVLARVALIDMSHDVLARGLRPYPVQVRTLDGLHLATMEFLRSRGQDVELASYDTRLLAAAAAMGFRARQP